MYILNKVIIIPNIPSPPCLVALTAAIIFSWVAIVGIASITCNRVYNRLELDTIVIWGDMINYRNC